MGVNRCQCKTALEAIIVLLCASLLSPVSVAGPAPDVVGDWLGTLLTPSNVGLRLVAHVTTDAEGKLTVSLDSVDEGVAGNHGTGALDGAHFSFEIPSTSARYSGTVSSDCRTIVGDWKQSGLTTPLTFARVTDNSVPTVVAQPTPAPAMPPVALDDLKAVLDRELAPVRDHGLLENGTGGGLVIGVLDHGQRRIFAYGTAEPDSIFEIGSVTKTFTGLMLAQMVAQKKVTLDEPVRELLPAGFVAKPDGSEITLIDLATHHSGLPREAGNLLGATYGDSDFGVSRFQESLAQHIAKPAVPEFRYSNFGFALLGYSLSQRAGLSYGQLLTTEITGPLHMNNTVSELSPAQRKHLIHGYNRYFNPVRPLNSGLFPAAGGIKSTAADLLTYLDANLHPEKYASGANSPLATLPAAIDIDHMPRASGVGENIALAWFINKSGTYHHSGETYGYTAYVAFNIDRDQALVVLYNRLYDGNVPYPDRVGENVSALMEGKPAIPLDVVTDDERESLRPQPAHVFSSHSISGTYDCSLAALPLAASAKDSIDVSATGDVHLIADGNGTITAGTMMYRPVSRHDLMCKFKLASGHYSIAPDGTGTETENWRLAVDESPRRCFAFASPARPPVTVEGLLKLSDTGGRLFHSASIAPFAMLNRACTAVSNEHAARTGD